MGFHVLHHTSRVVLCCAKLYCAVVCFALAKCDDILAEYNMINHNCVCWRSGSAHLDRDMFSLMWGPTVAAVSVVLDHAEDMATVRQALDGLLQAAKLGAYHHVDEVRNALHCIVAEHCHLYWLRLLFFCTNIIFY